MEEDAEERETPAQGHKSGRGPPRREPEPASEASGAGAAVEHRLQGGGTERPQQRAPSSSRGITRWHQPGPLHPPVLLPSPHCSAPRHGDELCPSERPRCLRPPQAGATSSPGPGWPTHPKPGSSPQSRASRPRPVRLVPTTAPAIPKQTRAPRPEKPSGTRPRGSAPRG